MTASAIPSSATCHNPASNRRALPIEEALRWAIRDELPKRRYDPALASAPSMPSIHPMWANGLFTRVDNWSREPGMPLAMGECHPDAERIEAAIAALDPEALDLTPYRIGHGLGTGCDLDHVIAMVRRDVVAWVITFAKRGGRPDLGEGMMCEPARGANHRPTLWHTVSTEAGVGQDGQPWFITSDQQTTMDKGNTYRTGTFCKLNWVRNANDVAEDRARYAIWHAALRQLADALQDLTSLAIRQPTAPATPWIEPPPATTIRLSAPTPSETDLSPVRHPVMKPRSRPPSPVRKIDPAEYPIAA